MQAREVLSRVVFNRALLASIAASMCLTSTAAMADPYKRIINVIDYGAKGNGVNDDTAAIQDALDDAKVDAARVPGAGTPGGVVVYFPEGMYRVTDTLSLNNSVNIEIQGAGAQGGDPRIDANPQYYHYDSDSKNPLLYVNGPQSSIVADFSTGSSRPLFYFQGQMGHSMSGLALFGAFIPGVQQACAGLIQTGSNGWGNTNNNFMNLRLVDSPYGIRLGMGSQDINNDSFIFERITAYNIATVFQPVTVQSLNLAFRQIGATNCTTVFDFDNAGNSGGAVSADTVSLTNCGGPGADDWVIKVYGQPNTGAYRFVNVRPETTTEQLLRSRGSGVTVLSSIQDARFYAASRAHALIRVEGGAVVVEASELMPNTGLAGFGDAHIVEFPSSTSVNCTFRVRDSLLPTVRPGSGPTNIADLIKNTTIPANCYFSIETCDGDQCQPLTDIKSGSAW